jgi:hypothetical protein
MLKGQKMNIGAVAELYSSAGYIRTVSDSVAVKRVAEISNLVTSSTIEKIASQDDSKEASSTSVNNSNNNLTYDFRFLPNIPLAKTWETYKTFNETEKTNKEEESSQESTDYYVNEEEASEESTPQTSNTGKGYYIVLSDSTPPQEKKTSYTAAELIQERIMNTYYPSRMRDNGTLVNLTF